MIFFLNAIFPFIRNIRVNFFEKLHFNPLRKLFWKKLYFIDVLTKRNNLSHSEAIFICRFPQNMKVGVAGHTFFEKSNEVNFLNSRAIVRFHAKFHIIYSIITLKFTHIPTVRGGTAFGPAPPDWHFLQELFFWGDQGGKCTRPPFHPLWKMPCPPLHPAWKMSSPQGRPQGGGTGANAPPPGLNFSGVSCH